MSRGNTVGIVGAGTFGTALAVALARAGRAVVLYTRTPAVAEAIAATGRCPRLPDVAVPAGVTVVTDPAALAAAARFVVVAVSSTDVGPRLLELGGVVDGSHLIVHAIGALAAPDDVRVSELIARSTPVLRSGVLAGPARPDDLAQGRFASMVVASAFDEVIAEARRLLNLPPALRLYGSHDLAGVELASALAGAYTVALGLADGAAVGVGPRAVLVTRAVAEARRLIEAAGGETRTFSGLAGLGNLLVRGATDDDPDYCLGQALARGEPLGERLTEGGRAAVAGLRLAERRRVRMPLLGGVAAVLSGRVSVADAARLAADTVAAEE
ncbi:MAG: NAD(P)-binding domain-containing protein [Kofleriaceae bacterium]